MDNQHRGKMRLSLAYVLRHRGFQVIAWYSSDPQRAVLLFQRNGGFYNIMEHPAYTIWNVAAHFNDIVERELCDESAKDAAADRDLVDRSL